MDWIWKRLAYHVGRVKTQVEFQGISEEALSAALRQEALRRLEWIEWILSSEELDDEQKIEALQNCLSSEE